MPLVSIATHNYENTLDSNLKLDGKEINRDYERFENNREIKKFENRIAKLIEEKLRIEINNPPLVWV